MPKPRTKRGADREERKRKRRDDARDNSNVCRPKRQRTEDANVDDDYVAEGYQDYQYPEQYTDQSQQHHNGPGEKEFFGMLADEEQEYFRRADEMLELNEFPTAQDRDTFLESVFREARGKELKLASSQSCSRLMERLIQLSSTAQKKHLFEAFGTHFLSLVQHRFASHCCEALFLRSAPVVSHELAGFLLDTRGANPAERNQPEASMEALFLATLDELEGSLSFLVTDRFASHALRALLLVLSGRPLDDASARTLLKSRRKEGITVAGSGSGEAVAVAAADEQKAAAARAVPASFALAVAKIITDSTAGLDETGLRVLARHPVGNPTLQLLLELDMTLGKARNGKRAAAETTAEASKDGEADGGPCLLLQLLPGAPKSLSDPSSTASEFINGMIYDQIGSRLVETLVQHCPGKMFKQLKQNFFLPRIEGYVRNDISCYPAIQVLNRLGKDDLIEAADRIVPTVPQLVSKSRFNVLGALLERCSARGAHEQSRRITRGLKQGCGTKQPADLVTTLCNLHGGNEEQRQKQQQKQGQDNARPKDHQPRLSRNEYAIQSHGAQLLTTMLSIPGSPRKAVHDSLLALPPTSLVRLANASMPAVTLLTTALSTPSTNSVFPKSLVSSLTPLIIELSTSQYGHNLVNAIARLPTKGKDSSIPFHLKEAIMDTLASHESSLRIAWTGRSVWRSWKGDTWKSRYMDWRAWMREDN